MIGRSFWTLLRVSELRSVWKMVTNPSRLAWLLAVQYTSSPSILSTCSVQPCMSQDLSCISDAHKAHTVLLVAYAAAFVPLSL